MKVCTKCKEEKTFDSFHRNKSSKDGYATYCKLCKSKIDKKYYEDNEDKIKSSAKEYRDNNKEKIVEYRKEYYSKEENKLKMYEASKKFREENKEILKIKKKKYREDNLDKIRERDRNYYQENKERIKTSVMESYYDNPEPYKIRARNRKAAKKNADDKYFKKDIEKLFTLQRGMCPYCKCSLDDGYHVDHIIPLSKGGSNWPENLQLLCPTCNLRKHAKDPFEWANELGLLL